VRARPAAEVAAAGGWAEREVCQEQDRAPLGCVPAAAAAGVGPVAVACHPSGGIKVVWMPCVALGLGPAAALCGPPVLSCVVGRGRFGEGLGVSAPRAVGNA